MAALEQDLRRLRHERDERQLRGRRRERLGVEEDALDVGVARDDVVAERRGEEDRRQAVERGQRIGQELGRERVELLDGGAGHGLAAKHAW